MKISFFFSTLAIRSIIGNNKLVDGATKVLPMIHPIANTLITLVIVIVVAAQARQSPARSYRRAAFTTAAIAFGILTLFNAKAVIDKEAGPWVVAVLWLVSFLMFASLILLFLSWRNGEMKEKIEQARKKLKDERERRVAHHQDDDTSTKE